MNLGFFEKYKAIYRGVDDPICRNRDRALMVMF